MAFTADSIMDKIGAAHDKVQGTAETVVLVRYFTVRESDFVQPQITPEETPLTHPPIVHNTIPEHLMPSFDTQLAADEKLFVLVTDSFVPRQPIATMSRRAAAFLRERAGTERGAIRYGDTDYSFDEITPVAEALGIIPQFAVRARAQVKRDAEL